VLAVVINHFQPYSMMRGAEMGVICWLGFAAPTSFATAIFSCKPKALWAIDSGFNLASFVIAGVILSMWH